MPSIEIICANQKVPLHFEELPFAVEAESELLSHRSPHPLFQAHFDELRGCIYHLGSPILRDPKSRAVYTAYQLLSREKGAEWWNLLHFSDGFIRPVQVLLELLIADSPTNRLIFTSDYQFGPRVRRYRRPLTLRRFWQLHEEKKLKMNALYQLEP